MNHYRGFLLAIILCMVFLFSDICYAGVISKTKSFITADWLTEQWLKYGMVSSLCAAQTFNGAVESHKFSGRHFVSESDYHVWRYGQSISMLTAGYFMTANIRTDKISWFTKTRRIIGSSLIARDFFEWTYRANRTGDPFNYSDKYSFNDKALVYFKFNWNEGKFIDMYISGTGRQGAFIDLSCLLLGWWIFK